MQRFIDDIREHAIEYGSIPFWSWNDKLDPQELRRQIRIMHGLKMNGFFMHARGGLETEYLSEEWFECIRACVDEAQKLGMEAWSYDENGWPSGFAGGILLKDRANWATFLKYETSEAFPEESDVLGVYVIEENRCRRVFAPEAGAAEYTVIRQGWDESYVDTMDPAITQKFIAATHEEYKRRVGFSKHMPGFFVDEPQYYRWATPWSDTMPAQFESRYGYDVKTLLPALFVDFEGAEEFRWDYYRLCHELFINGFIKTVYEWCEANGCMLTGHAVEEATLHGQMFGCGGVMPFYQYEHIPGVDYLSRRVPGDIAYRQLGSVCAQLGKKKALSEMFACCGWDVSPNELKRIADVQYVNGVNLMCQHLYPYSIRGQRKTDYPCFYSEHLPWQAHMKHFNEYYNHLGYILSRGTEQVRVLVIHPIHSAYLTYKRKNDRWSVKELQDDFFALNSLLSENQIPYHFGDECMLADMAKVQGDKIQVGLCTYDRVVVPAMDSIDANTAQMLKEYIANGGKLYLFGKTPCRVDGKKANLDWLRATCGVEALKETADLTIARAGKNVPQLRQMTRVTEYGRAIYVTNLTDELLENVRVSVKNCASLCAIDLNTLQVRSLPCETADGDCSVTLTFEDSAAYLLMEGSADAPALAPVRCSEPAIRLNGTFRLAKPVDNMMTLDFAQLSYDGKTYEPARPMILIRDLLLRSRYRGELYLKYTFTAKDAPRAIRLAAEPMRYYAITVNGQAVSLDGEWWTDRSFRTADIAPYVRAGENEIILHLDYFQRDYVYYVLYGGVSESLRNCLNFDTEVESIYLVGDFAVEMDTARMTREENNAVCYDGAFALAARKETIDLTDIVTDGYPFFGGTIEAETTYTHCAGGATELYVGGRYSVCEVLVNGEKADTLLFRRHANLAAYLREGENKITLRLTNTLRNLLGPHHFIESECFGVSPSVFLLESQWKDEQCPNYRERYAFVRFGVDV